MPFLSLDRSFAWFDIYDSETFLEITTNYRFLVFDVPTNFAYLRSQIFTVDDIECE